MGKSNKIRGLFSTIVNKLLAWFLLVALVPLFILGYLSYTNDIQLVKNEVTNNLIAISKSKINNIESYFKERKKDIVTLAGTQDVINGLEKINSAYISNGIDSHEYEFADGEIRKFLTTYMEINSYYDLFLISPSGDIVFTVKQEKDFDTNLLTGRFNDTELTRVFKRAHSMAKPEISDFRYYLPSDEPAAFIAMPVFKKGKLLGVLAAKLNRDQIYALAHDFTGLGETGETVIATQNGNGVLFVVPTRHDMLAAFGKTIAFGSKEASPIQQAVQGKSGSGESIDYRNVEILATWNYFPIMRWGIVVKIDTAEALAQVYFLTMRYLILGTITLIGVITIAFFLSKTISRPIRILTETTELIAAGDLSVKARVRTNDEIGILANSFNEMVVRLQRIIEENDKQNWLKTGQMELSNRMSGEQDIGMLGENIISYLAEYINAQIGTIYMACDNNRLKLIGSYAFSQRKNISNEFMVGEGLVGQVALEKKYILLTSCPDSYFGISSGLGEAIPKNILVFPLQMGTTVKGVVELGSFCEFSETELFFLSNVQEGIAIALYLAADRERTSLLLKQTQSQAKELKEQQEKLQTTNEELQEQQEEMKATNEELEEQTWALRESESRLQSQQEELRAINQELEGQKEEVERKNKEFAESQKLIEEKAREVELASKYKSEFLANMSHELRTPLNSILLLSGLLSNNKEGNLTKDDVESAQTINSSGTDLLNLINEILDLSKIEAGKMEIHIDDMGLQDFCSAMEQRFKPLATEKMLKLNIELAEGLPTHIRTDQQRVEQIVENFLSNAFKFTAHGSITLRIDRKGCFEQGDLDLQNNSLEPAKSVAFSVIDTGIGIPKDKKKLIFEAFQQADGTTSRKYGGTGLGLSIVQKFTKILGGNVSMESEQGKGSTFILCIPESIESDLETEDWKIETEEIEYAPFKSERKVTAKQEEMFMGIEGEMKTIKPDDISILIIEDDYAFLKILRDLSREKGFKYLVARDGRRGLQLADDYKPSAIILDIGLPDVNGWGVMARLKENPATRHIPVHVISAADKKSEAMKMGAVDYLTKPVSMRTLERVYDKLNNIILKQVKDLLLVVDNKDFAESIVNILGNGDVKITNAATVADAYNQLLSGRFDCVVLDLGFSNMQGMDLLKRIRKNNTITHIPIIILTEKELSKHEKATIDEYVESTIVKGKDFSEKLLDETTLFLHRVEACLPKEKQKLIRMMHNKDEILADKTILLVDDDMRNVFSLKKILEDKGMHVLVGKNGKDGLSRLTENPDINIVLMDIMMPEMDGYEATREIRRQEKFNNLPIIALTAKAMKGDRTKCIEAGANDYLAKPLDLDRLFSVLRVWLY